MDLNHPLLLAEQGPPPFPSSHPQFTRLDNSVVCQICKESFKGPVSISCGHSFCSRCIRSSLDVMKKCPTCNETTNEGSIRRNRALEEITDAWEDARHTIMNLIPTKKRPPPEPNSKASSSTSVNKKIRQNSPVKVVEVKDEEENEEEELDENDEGECPICSARLPIASIPTHIDRGCPPTKNGRVGSSKADWKKVFAGTGGGSKGKEIEMKRIKKPNYALTTPADLRAILSEHSLPTTGDKAMLILRLQEWIIIYNSNLDTSHPKTLPAMRAQLASMEEARKRDKEKGKEDAVRELGTKEGLERYGREKKDEFDRLRREVMERDKKRSGGQENAIEID